LGPPPGRYRVCLTGTIAWVTDDDRIPVKPPHASELAHCSCAQSHQNHG